MKLTVSAPPAASAGRSSPGRSTPATTSPPASATPTSPGVGCIGRETTLDGAADVSQTLPERSGATRRSSGQSRVEVIEVRRMFGLPDYLVRVGTPDLDT